MSVTRKIVTVFICVFCILLGTGYFLGMAYFQTHYKIGTTINGFHLSFQTVEEAEELLARKVESYAIAVNTRNNGVEKITADEVGLTFQGKEELVNLLRGQNSKLWFLPEFEGYHLPAACYAIDQTKLAKAMDALKCMQHMVKAESAHIVEDQDFYQVSKAVKGTELDRQKASSVIETAIRKWSSEVDLEESGCYIDADPGEEERLQKQCDILNAIQEEVITYDFGDRKETVTYDTVKQDFLTDQYLFDEEAIRAYVEKLAETYDTTGQTRKFVTYDDRTVTVKGGTYGWRIDVEKTTEDLLENIKSGTIDVVEPVYQQRAASRDKNDIGRSYLELDTVNRQAILYIDGTPAVQADMKANDPVEPGCYKISDMVPETSDGKEKAILFGNAALYLDNPEAAAPSFSGTDDISGFSKSSIAPGCMTTDEETIDAIYGQLDKNWPVIVYGG